MHVGRVWNNPGFPHSYRTKFHWINRWKTTNYISIKSLAPKQTQKNNCQTRQKNWERRAKTGRGGIGKQNRGQGDNGSGGDHAEKNGYSAAAPAKAVIMTKNTSGGQSSSGSEGSIPRTQNKEVAPVSNSIPLGSCLRRALFSLLRVTQPLLIIFGRPRPTRYRTKGIMVSAPSVSVRKWSFSKRGWIEGRVSGSAAGRQVRLWWVQTFGWFWCLRAPTWNVKAQFPFRARLLLRVHVRLLVRFRGWYCFYCGGEGKVKQTFGPVSGLIFAFGSRFGPGSRLDVLVFPD